MKHWISSFFKSEAPIGLKGVLVKYDQTKETSIESIHSVWRELNEREVYKFDEFFNAYLYSSIIDRDILLLWTNYSKVLVDSKKNLYGRLLIMTLIEFLEDINILLGKDLRPELIKNGMENFVSQVNIVNKEFAVIKKQNNTVLRHIRNNASAHKTKKAKDLIGFTRQEYFDNLNEITSKVFQNNIKLTELNTKIMNVILKELRGEIEHKPLS